MLNVEQHTSDNAYVLDKDVVLNFFPVWFFLPNVMIPRLHL